VLECAVAIDAIADNAQDTPPLRTARSTCWRKHVLGCACGEPFLSDELYQEVLTAACYSGERKDFDDVVDFVATGGYALKSYERLRASSRTRTPLARRQSAVAAKLSPQRRPLSSKTPC